MARAGIDRHAVQQARDALQARGDNPSIDAVRIELGNTGSKSTIHRYLKELEQPPVTLENSTCLSAPISQLVAQLATQLQQEGQARIDVAEATFNRQCEQLRSQLDLAQRALAAAHQQHQAEVSALQARLSDKDQHIHSLETRREQEQRRQETQVRQLQGQLHTLQQGALARQEELTRLHRDNERLLAEQRQALEARKALEAQLEQRDAQVQGLRAILGQAQGAGEELRRQCAERDAQIAELRRGGSA